MTVMDSMLRGRLADAEAGNAPGDSRSPGVSVRGLC
jgi:hypothetical protein